MKIMKENDWEKQKDRPEIKPYYLVKHELYQTKGLLFRCRQIVIPEKLQKQAIIAAHSLGHFGMTRTKQMLQAKYWFPRLNSMFVANMFSLVSFAGMTLNKCAILQIGTLTGCPLCRESHP